MNKEEVLNDDFVENEVVQPKSHKKIKIAIAITASLELLLLLFYQLDTSNSIGSK